MPKMASRPLYNICIHKVKEIRRKNKKASPAAAATSHPSDNNAPDISQGYSFSPEHPATAAAEEQSPATPPEVGGVRFELWLPGQVLGLKYAGCERHSPAGGLRS